MDSGFLHRAFLLAACGLCMSVGLSARIPALEAFALAVLLLVGLSWSTARRRLSGLHVSRRAPGSAFEDEEVRVEVALENRGRAAVSLVEVVDSFGAALADRKALLDPGPLRPGRRHRLAYRTVCSRLWGAYTVGPLAVSVSDPLGLFTPRRALPDVRPFDLFPRVHPVGGLDRLGSRSSFVASEPTIARAGQSALYLGVRDFRAGDEVRRVHSSAARRGDTVQLFGEGRRAIFVPPGRGDLHLALALDQLIRVRQDGALDVLDLALREQAALPPGSTAALLSASLFLDSGRLSEALGGWRARRVRPVVVAVDQDSFLPIDVRSRPRSDVQARTEELRSLSHAHGALLAVLGTEQDLEEELMRPDWLGGA